MGLLWASLSMRSLSIPLIELLDVMSEFFYSKVLWGELERSLLRCQLHNIM
ncbi:MAG: hypothetical protein AAGJ08_09100 [Cyanobacteria bacterium P01_H01_bin.35]